MHIKLKSIANIDTTKIFSIKTIVIENEFHKLLYNFTKIITQPVQTKLLSMMSYIILILSVLRFLLATSVDSGPTQNC